LIIAICAAGPPQARQPNLRKRAKTEPGESMRAIFVDPRFHLLTP
jgi:hypothetical protein